MKLFKSTLNSVLVERFCEEFCPFHFSVYSWLALHLLSHIDVYNIGIRICRLSLNLLSLVDTCIFLL